MECQERRRRIVPARRLPTIFGWSVSWKRASTRTRTCSPPWTSGIAHTTTAISSCSRRSRVWLGISETTLAGLNKVESFRESDRKELTQALLAALTAAPKTNRAGSVIGMVLGSVALAVVIVLIVMGRLH